MNETMIENHNALVKPGDDVYDLGDFAFGRDSDEAGVRSVLHRLHGNLHFIWGNHDKLFAEVIRKNPELVVWTKDIYEFKKGEIDIILFHYAMRTWNHSHRGSFHLYGHTHATLPEDNSLSFDIGVDAWDFKPVHLDEVIKKMNAKRKNWTSPIEKDPWIPVKEN